MPCIHGCRLRIQRKGILLTWGWRQLRCTTTCGCVLSKTLSGVAIAENALKSGQTTCRIIFWHPAVYWKVGSRGTFCVGSGVALQNWEHEPWDSNWRNGIAVNWKKGQLLCLVHFLVLHYRSLLHHCKTTFKNGMRAWFGFRKYFYRYCD